MMLHMTTVKPAVRAARGPGRSLPRDEDASPPPAAAAQQQHPTNRIAEGRPPRATPSRIGRHAPAPAPEPACAARCGRARCCDLRTAAPLRSISQVPPR